MRYSKEYYNYCYPYSNPFIQSPWYYNNNFTSPMYMNRYENDNFNSQTITKSQLDLSNKIRELWEQHTVWTRATIASMVFDLPDVSFVTDRLLQNPEDFGNTFSVFYGNKIGSTFRDLMKEHLVIAAQLVNAAKAGNTKEQSEIEKKWYENGDKIATFLGSINPHWSVDEWKKMFRTHLGLVKEEAVNLLTKNYADEASVYDELERQALEMADEMVRGIIEQFPEKFR